CVAVPLWSSLPRKPASELTLNSIRVFSCVPLFTTIAALPVVDPSASLPDPVTLEVPTLAALIVAGARRAGTVAAPRVPGSRQTRWVDETPPFRPTDPP